LNYFSYLFSDKKAKDYWIFFYSTYGSLLILGLSSQEKYDFIAKEDLFGVVINLILLFSFPIYYTQSFCYYYMQEKFLKVNSHLITKESLKRVCVVIQLDKIGMTAPMKNYKVKIKTKSYNDKFRVCEIGDDLIIIGQVYNFKIFRQHIKPIIIRRGEKLEKTLYQSGVEINEYSIKTTDTDLEIHLLERNFGIKSITIKDWIKVTNANNVHS
jgi:hypothetical protein